MYEILDHPADIGFRVRGATLEELFSRAAGALLAIAGRPEAVEPLQQHPIAVESGDLDSLLVDWLNEVLYLLDGRRIAFREFRVSRVLGASLAATGYGEPFDPGRHHAKVTVKAATYHQLRLEREAGGWVAEVYVDV